MSAGCPACGCGSDAAAHAVAAALAVDDVDRALDAGLLDAAACPCCSIECTAALLDARTARRQALDARARHRARAQRLARRGAERAERRQAASALPAALPPAAAAALARALARGRPAR